MMAWVLFIARVWCIVWGRYGNPVEAAAGKRRKKDGSTWEAPKKVESGRRKEKKKEKKKAQNESAKEKKQEGAPKEAPKKYYLLMMGVFTRGMQMSEILDSQVHALDGWERKKSSKNISTERSLGSSWSLCGGRMRG